MATTHSATYFEEMAVIASKIPVDAVERLAEELVALRERNGRLFFFGVGGSAGNCGHAVNDFRKLCGIESYAPTDNVSELTARTNDEGWASVFVEWLRGSRLRREDGLMVLSVGGGNLEEIWRGTSVRTWCSHSNTRNPSVQRSSVLSVATGVTLPGLRTSVASFLPLTRKV